MSYTGKTKTESFDDMNLKENLLRGIYGYGFEEPSEIQQLAIVPLTSGVHLIGQAKSGTGKTGTFTIGCLQNIDETSNKLQALIMAHTRELALQIKNVISAIGAHMKVKVHACIGGKSVQSDIDALHRGVHIVVGTPGRVKDMISRKALDTSQIKFFCIDEADEMLSFGFKDQIYDVFKYIPESAQIAIFSATLEKEVLEVTDQFMHDPEKILLSADKITLEGIQQYYVDVSEEQWKFDTLCDLYETLSVTQAIIYVNTRRRVEWLAEQLSRQNHMVSIIHGDLSQSEREQIMSEFREGKTRILITTDLLARGIDVQQVSLVLNYDLPNKKDNYIHRIGRSGRYGRKGTSINFLVEGDYDYMREIEQHYNTRVTELPGNIDEILGQI
jgi:translation initiation factor 4A